MKAFFTFTIWFLTTILKTSGTTTCSLCITLLSRHDLKPDVTNIVFRGRISVSCIQTTEPVVQYRRSLSTHENTLPVRRAREIFKYSRPGDEPSLNICVRPAHIFDCNSKSVRNVEKRAISVPAARNRNNRFGRGFVVVKTTFRVHSGFNMIRYYKTDTFFVRLGIPETFTVRAWREYEMWNAQILSIINVATRAKTNLN